MAPNLKLPNCKMATSCKLPLYSKLSFRRANVLKRVSGASRNHVGPRRWLFRINRRHKIGFAVRLYREGDYLRSRPESSFCGIERVPASTSATRPGTRRNHLSYCQCAPFSTRSSRPYPLACLRMKMMHSGVMGSVHSAS